MGLTHLDPDGNARMVDVGHKPSTLREATASGRIEMRPETLAHILAGDLPKGDVLAAARIAGIQAAKQTSALIPLCHPIALTRVAVDVRPAPPGDGPRALIVTATAGTNGPTGVEMEALTAVSVALLTLYDMAKAIDRGMRITAIELESKSGGASGEWRRVDAPGAAGRADAP
ncbi:MAG: cyclic pyranopterin monophosphate synthase MoaC [Ardenticatenales bacterium]